MGLGRVCSIHEEYCPTGECRWCEPLPTDGHIQSVTNMLGGGMLNMQQAQQAMGDCWGVMWQAAGQAQQQQWPVYAPNANAAAANTGSGFPWGFPTWGHWK